MIELKKRNDFPQLLRSMGLTGWAAEVGTAEGYFSHNLLDHWGGRCVQIDPWALLDEPGFSAHGAATNDEQEARYQRILHAAQRYNGRCLVQRATSEEAAKDYADGFFSFVYLDAQHDLESARRDIALWWPKVRSGGILSGHDYLDGVFHGQQYGVKQAVDEHAAAHGLEVGVVPEEWPSFWIVKP